VQGLISLEVEGELRHVAVGSSATLWRGGEQPLGALRAGDRVLVRLESGELGRAWANLTRWRGTAIEKTDGGFVGGMNARPAVDIVTNERTRYEDAFTGDRGTSAGVAIERGIDVIGRDLDGAIEASLIRYESGPAPALKATLPVTPDIQCRLTYNGIASWFVCSGGSGRCGTCSTSRSDQTAWPAFDRCGCCNSSCCDCAKNCLAQWYLPCGYGVEVADVCTGRIKDVFIADCGPCNNQSCASCPVTCSHSCGGCSTRTTPVVDLTKPTFAYFRDPASNGCFPARAVVTVNCT
jgi:hypothetical protein